MTNNHVEKSALPVNRLDTTNCHTVFFEEATSTNDAVVALARQQSGVSSAFAAVAKRQTKGRGRLGRTWDSPKGGVYLSILLPLAATFDSALSKSATNDDRISALSPLAALIVRDVLQLYTQETICIKWPNDIHAASGKLAGILVELKNAASVFGKCKNKAEPVFANQQENSDAAAALVAIIGIGVNVKRPTEGAFRAAAYLDDFMHYSCISPQSLALPRREDIAAAIINSFIARFRRWQSLGYDFSSFSADYMLNMNQIGQEVCVRDAFGNELAQGLIVGVDGQARLLLKNEYGVSKVSAGEVTLRI